jgi:hypothetical protein
MTEERIRERLAEGQELGYQLYWCLYCIAMNKLFTHFTGDGAARFIGWINQRHREYEPDPENRKKEGYIYRFAEWLIKWIEEKTSEGAA